MAWSAHVLAWGLTKWKDGYVAANQLDQMYDSLKTPLDYFLKCWRPSENKYYAQVIHKSTWNIKSIYVKGAISAAC